MEYSLHYVIVSEDYERDSNSWNVTVTDRTSYEAIDSALDTQDKESLNNALDTACIMETLAEDVGKEEAMSVATDYADSHIITVIMEIPYI